jgi:hypothetical protein
MNNGMTVDEAMALLKRLGIKIGEWGETEEKTGVPPVLNNQVKAFLQVRSLLQNMMETDVKRVAALQEQLLRLKYGGGS